MMQWNPQFNQLRATTIPWLLFAVTQLLFAHSAVAHGSIEVPLSRVYNCYLEGPESPDSAACQAAVDEGGTQGLYDWNGVNIGDANGNHQQIIPSGQLCSAGRDLHRGLDLARDDWVSTQIEADADGNFEFIYYATAPHSSLYFQFYITRPGYDPTQPLGWEDLEDEPFCEITEVELVNERYSMTCPLPPARDGKHVIYNIWQRDTSEEAFYACVDIEFANAVADTDSDGIADTLDNCTNAPNATQTDADEDGYGNLCDADLNNDCIVNVQDLGLFRAQFFGSDPAADFNGDGVVNVVDLGILRSLFFAAPGPSALGTCVD